MHKLQEVKPNVKLWFRDEAQAQPAYNEGEVSLGQFYHDITLFAASEAGGGDPLRSVFPTEGAILDSGFWSISKTTENLGACVAFIDYMCRPEVQQELALTLGTIPSTKRETLTMTDEEYEAVAGPGPEVALRPEVRDLRQVGGLDRPELDRADPLVALGSEGDPMSRRSATCEAA